jgi:predicted kinase
MNNKNNDIFKHYFIVMRAVSGTGKTFSCSTIKNTIAINYGYEKYVKAFSADNYWIQPDGSYKINMNDIYKAHEWCLKNTIEAIVNGSKEEKSFIFLDNTNTHYNEFAHYNKVAKAFGYHNLIIKIKATKELCLKRQTHNCPESVIDKQFEKMKEKVPKHLGILLSYDNIDDNLHENNMINLGCSIATGRI